MTELIARAAALTKLLSSQTDFATREIVEATLHCCEALVAAGEPRLALALLEKSDQTQFPDPIWKLRREVLRARAFRVAGEYEKGFEVANSALIQFADQSAPPSPAYYATRLVMAGCLWQLNRVDDALSQLHEIRAELIRQPDSLALAFCAHELASAELFRGGLENAKRHALEAVVSARRCGSRHIEALALSNLGRIDKFLCRWGSSRESLESALNLHEENGNRVETIVCRRLLAIVAWKAGRLQDSCEMAERCAEEAAGLSNEVNQWYGALLLGLIAIHRGDLDRARELFGEGTTKDAPHAESRRSLLTGEYIGDAHLEEGSAEEALDRYERVWPLAVALVPKGDIIAELRRRRAEAYLLLGRFQEAYDGARAALEHCRELGDRYEEAATYRTLALSAAALGKPVEAKQWFDQGFAYYEDIETPYEWGKLWMAYGDWLRGPHAAEYSSPTRALEAYQAARDHFEGMGALGKLAEAEARLAECAASLETPPPPVAPLTEARRPLRRPRGSAEMDRRSEWAREQFGLVTRNRMMLDLLSDVAKLAQSGSALLILGESGTGKELVAEGIHRLSGRDGKFMPINCGALPRDVIESELFGHMAGSFTSASRDKAGLVEACHDGTVFLDEIGEMSIDLQSKLLRFLETGEFRRVGSTKVLTVNTLVIAATNRDRASLESGSGFRADLFYRLAHAVITLPPLRRRGEDIDLLIDHFLESACTRFGKRVRLSAAARNRLIAYSWPGNVRQLRSSIHRLAILAPPDSEIGPGAVELSEAGAPSGLMQELEQAERRRIVEALAQAKGVRTEAAKILGMSRTTFLGKMKRFGIR